jgi:NADH dehydrogenase (ubiquinone) 1 alpha subcomplex subunit 4
MAGQLQNFLKVSKSKPEIFPLIAILTCALSGAAYYGVHAMKAPDVVW